MATRAYALPVLPTPVATVSGKGDQPVIDPVRQKINLWRHMPPRPGLAPCWGYAVRARPHGHRRHLRWLSVERFGGHVVQQVHGRIGEPTVTLQKVGVLLDQSAPDRKYQHCRYIVDALHDHLVTGMRRAQSFPVFHVQARQPRPDWRERRIVQVGKVRRGHVSMRAILTSPVSGLIGAKEVTGDIHGGQVLLCRHYLGACKPRAVKLADLPRNCRLRSITPADSVNSAPLAASQRAVGVPLPFALSGERYASASWVRFAS